jgi:hypothetical protein
VPEIHNVSTFVLCLPRRPCLVKDGQGVERGGPGDSTCLYLLGLWDALDTTCTGLLCSNSISVRSACDAQNSLKYGASRDHSVYIATLCASTGHYFNIIVFSLFVFRCSNGCCVALICRGIQHACSRRHQRGNYFRWIRATTGC